MHDIEDVRRKAIDYFKSDLVANVWLDKYALKNKQGDILELSPEDTYERIAQEFIMMEEQLGIMVSSYEIRDLIGRYIFPAGSPMFGIGNKYSISSLSNCFVIDSPIDSYGGILKTDEELVQLMKRRGGVGCDISTIRPQGSLVNNAAGTSTGIIPFMKRYSNSTNEVAQDGRRGALILTLDINHPDILKFISAKDDIKDITGANISIKITDKFMQSVIDEDVKSRFIWDKIIHQAWKTAEPGVLFIDKIQKESPADCYGSDWESISCNPCVSGETLILTDTGYHPISNCVNKKTNVWNGVEFSVVTPRITGKTKQWYTFTFSDGSTLKCTPYHKFYLKNYNTTLSANQLVLGDKLNKFIFPIINDTNNKISKDLYTYGFYCGDGSIKRHEPIIDLYGKKKLLLDLLSYRKYHKEKDGISWRLYLGKKEEYNKSFVPDSSFSIISKLTYLAGLIDSDGSLNSLDGSLNISSINKDFLINIKYLLNTLGTTGVISLMKKSCKKLMPNGHGGSDLYNCKTSYRIILSATNVKKLIDLGLKTHRVKLIANPNRDASRFITITSIEIINVNNENTYCFNEPLRHSGIFNGILTGQCGELPLCPYDSCRLMHINLYEFVINPFTPQASFNYNFYKRVVSIAQYLMDDLVELEREKIHNILTKISLDPEPDDIKKIERELWTKINEKLILGRRTGLNPLLGLADCLAALNIKYDSDEAIIFSSDIAQIAAIQSYSASIQMAKIRGAFELWDVKKEENNPFIKRILHKLSPLVLQEYYKYGRRNIANLTIPPSGTISLIAGVSSGIEPVFDLVHTRKRKVNEDHPNKKFKDENGNWWEEYKVYHSKYQECLDKMPQVLQGEPLRTPYHGSTSHEIDPIQKVKLQGAIQKWIDHSISITHNLSETTTREDVCKIYFEAYKNDCKGVTIYREGSRDGVLKSSKNAFKQHDAPKRPKVMPHDIYSIMSKGHHWVVCIGMLEDKPYEIFAFNNINLPGTKFAGEMIKQAKGKYDLSIRDIGYFDDITKDCSDEENLLTRMISTSLRHGADIRFIVDQLNKSTGDITSFGKGIGRVLKKYVPTGVNKNACPQCGDELINEGGCDVCHACGYSKCS